MVKKVVLHTLILIAATFITFLWVSDEKLSYFSLQLSAILLLTLIFTHKILKPVTFHLVESTISTIVILLIVRATGGITSPLFFLNYFLLFELSLLLEPVIPILLSASFILFYFLTSESNISPLQWLALTAFPFMTPLAYFSGRIYQKEENQKKEIKGLEKKIEKLEEELVEEEIVKSKSQPLRSA